jgi:mono/diheme cytochrome c family protein
MRMKATIFGCLLALAIPFTASAEDAGKAPYDKQCASCHGADGKGNEAKAKVLKIDPATLNLGRDEVANQSRDEKKKITAEGKGKMPAYAKKLQPAELDAVTDYTMSLIKAIRGK